MRINTRCTLFLLFKLGRSAAEDRGVEGMPPGVPVAYWERPQYDDKNVQWSIAPEELPIDLIINNKHLIKYNVLVSIISGIQSLEELGRTKPFEPDHQGLTYFYNGGPNWKPWNHIYSMTRAGRGSSHVLKCNKGGLYFVRLFYMGEWRRIHVTDLLPYGEDGRLLLPCSTNRYNLWPQLLTKALLQVAYLSSHQDFDVVACLTGWTLYRIDARYLHIDAAWNVLQMYLVEGPDSKTSREFCLSSSDQDCLIGDAPFFCYDSVNWRNIFAVVSRTENELDNISPAEEHTLCIMAAEVDIENDVETLPCWKKYRWVDWAREEGGLRESLGIVKRKIKLYSPFVKLKKPDPYSEENIRNLVENVIDGKIITGRLKELLMDKVRESEARKPEDGDDKLLSYDFSSIYPWIREFRIYYKAAQFKYVLHTTDIESIFTVHVTNSRRISKNANDQKVSNLKDNYRMKTFFLYSDSKFCKDFFVTLSVYVVEEEKLRPYVTCEEYSWKSTAQGRILFDLSTFGSVTHLLQLGPSVQVCRFWYSLPPHYNFHICGNTHFELLNEEGLQQKLSIFSETFISFGENLAKAFDQMRNCTLNSTDHFRALYRYKECFYPPTFDDLPEDKKNKLAEDFHQVFDESLVEVIFEELPSLTLLAAAIEIYKLIFNNEQHFEKVIKTLASEDRAEIRLAQENVCTSQKYYTELVSRDLNVFMKERNVEGDAVARQSVKGDRPSSVATKKSIMDVFKYEDTSILSVPQNNIKLLRKILNKKKEYLNMYPFRNEHELKLEFHDFVGSTEINVLQKWFLITRLICNVHSVEPVPCNIQVKTNLSIKVTLVLYDIDSSQYVSPSFALNRTYYVPRTQSGYAVLLYACPNEDMVKAAITTKWKIRITGIDKGNILHVCYKLPLLCKGLLNEPLDVYSSSISGFYFPNSENVIARFQIRTKSSPVVSFYFSLARPDLWMRVVIRTGDTEVCAVEGKGSAIIPLLVLGQNIAVTSATNLEAYIFKGEIQLIDHWVLNKEEKLFVRYLRSLPEKDILSLEDFENYVSNMKEGPEPKNVDDESEEREDEKDGKYAGKFGDILFDPEDSDSSDDYGFYTEREFKTEPFGLLSDAPYWRVSMVIDDLNKEDTLLLHDDQRLKEFEMFKISWEENDPGRAQKGEELRNEFLKFGSKDFLQKQLDPDDLNISDYSECGIQEGLDNLDRFSFMSSKKKLTPRRKKKASNKKTVPSDLFVDKEGKGGVRTDGMKILKRDSDVVKVETESDDLSEEVLDGESSDDSSLKWKGGKGVLTSSVGKMVRVQMNHFSPDVVPRSSLLADLPPPAKLFPLIQLYKKYSQDYTQDKLFDSNTLTGIILKMQSVTSKCLEYTNIDPDEFQFDLPQENETLTIKDIKELAKHDYNWEFIVSEILEPEFYPITKRKLPNLLDTPPMFLKDNYMSIVKNALDNYLSLKNEADDHICTIKEKMESLIFNKEEDTFSSPRSRKNITQTKKNNTQTKKEKTQKKNKIK